MPRGEWDGLIDGVDAPSIPCPIQEIDLERLKILVSLLDENDCYGLDSFLKVLSFVSDYLP